MFGNRSYWEGNEFVFPRAKYTPPGVLAPKPIPTPTSVMNVPSPADYYRQPLGEGGVEGQSDVSASGPLGGRAPGSFDTDIGEQSSKGQMTGGVVSALTGVPALGLLGRGFDVGRNVDEAKQALQAMGFKDPNLSPLSAFFGLSSLQNQANQITGSKYGYVDPGGLGLAGGPGFAVDPTTGLTSHQAAQLGIGQAAVGAGAQGVGAQAGPSAGMGGGFGLGGDVDAAGMEGFDAPGDMGVGFG